MAKSDDVKAKANEVIREINRKATRLSDCAAQTPSASIVAEAALLRAQIINRLDVLQEIITQVLEVKEE